MGSVTDTIREVVEKYGFKEIKTPIFEDLELFTTKSGEGIKEEIYHFLIFAYTDLHVHHAHHCNKSFDIAIQFICPDHDFRIRIFLVNIDLDLHLLQSFFSECDIE